MIQADDVLAILHRLEDRLEPLVTCQACGCLCRPSEVCPCCHPERGTELR